MGADRRIVCFIVGKISKSPSLRLKIVFSTGAFRLLNELGNLKAMTKALQDISGLGRQKTTLVLLQDAS